MKKFSVLLLAVVAMVCGRIQATASTDVVSSEGAWCWFADPRAIHHENADKSINNSYLGYIDVHGNIRAAQYNFNTGERKEVLVRSYFQPDDHNNPTFLVLPDERVLIIYSRHTDEPAFYYRVSKRPGDITDLGEEKCIKTANNTTYPSPFILSDDPTHFYLCWRGIGWHPTIAKLTLPDANDNVTVEWGPYQMVQSTGARPYAKYYSNGKDKLYFTYTTGHPDNEQPNWVYFNVVDIQATKDASGKVTTNPILTDIKGNKLSTIAQGKFNVNKTNEYKNAYPNTIVEAPSNLRDWVWQIVSDENDNPVIAMVKINGGKSQHEYYYAKWTGNGWRLTDLADGGGKFHSSNTEYCYSGGMAIDPQNVNVVYLSIPTEGTHGKIYEIWKYTLDNNGNITAKEQITKNSEKNNVRPYILQDSEGTPMRLAWMNGDYYYWMVQKNYPKGYPTAIISDYEYTPNITNTTFATNTIFNETLAANETESVATTTAGNPFTLMMTVTIDPSDYKGTILSSKGLKYELEGTSKLPKATVGTNAYVSTNKLYTSDAWATNSGGTSGDNWPTPLTNLNLTFTYDGNTLTIYRNGLIDQVIAAPGLSIEDMKLGGFKGTLSDYHFSPNCMNQDEIKQAISDAAFDVISVPETADTDLVLPTSVNGEALTWASSHPEILAADGTFRAPAAATMVTLTAKAGESTRTFNVTANPRNLANNLLASYDFEEGSVVEEGSKKYVSDLSGKDNKMQVCGSAIIDGTLNLTSNSPTAFSTNGYGLLPADILNNVRSYTIVFDGTITSSSKQPRFYDLGSNSGNSVFLRASALTAGVKYGGGTTIMVDASTSLQTNRAYKLAVTYDARTKMTTIYVDNKAVGTTNTIVNEPYMLVLADADRNYVGRTQWWDANVANDNQDLIGTIDNFKLYNTCLTPDELQAINNGTDVITTIDKAALNSNVNLYNLYGFPVKEEDATKGIFIKQDGNKATKVLY